MTTDFPAIAPEELRELEAESGRTLTTQQAHQYRLRKTHRELIDDMLAKAGTKQALTERRGA